MLVTSRLGGMPCRSANKGERTGSLRSVLPTYSLSGKMIRIGGLQLAGKAVQSEQLPRVTDPAEVSQAQKRCRALRAEASPTVSGEPSLHQ